MEDVATRWIVFDKLSLEAELCIRNEKGRNNYFLGACYLYETHFGKDTESIAYCSLVLAWIQLL